MPDIRTKQTLFQTLNNDRAKKNSRFICLTFNQILVQIRELFKEISYKKKKIVLNTKIMKNKKRLFVILDKYKQFNKIQMKLILYTIVIKNQGTHN